MLPYTPATCEPVSLTPRQIYIQLALMTTAQPSNTFALVLSSLLCVGLVGSYLPQHLRIINNKSSEGLSPIYLCLGSISSACGVGNLLLLQWPLLRCCSIIVRSVTQRMLGSDIVLEISPSVSVFRVLLLRQSRLPPSHPRLAALLLHVSFLSAGSLFTELIGVAHLLSFVLYFIYFPTQLKYASPLAHEHPVDTSKGGLKTTRLWKLSIALAVLTVAQLYVS